MCTGQGFSIQLSPRMIGVRHPHIYEWRTVLSPEIGTNKRLFPLFLGKAARVGPLAAFLLSEAKPTQSLSGTESVYITVIELRWW